MQFFLKAGFGIFAILMACAAPTLAQDIYSMPQPPVIPVRDENGVDILNATWLKVFNEKLASPIDPDLYFQLTTVNGGVSKWRSNFNAYVEANRDVGNSGYNNNYSVVVGNNTYAFTHINGTHIWTDTYRGGNTFIYDATLLRYVLTTRDGTRYIFSEQPFITPPNSMLGRCVAGSSSNSLRVCAVVTSIEFPSGKIHNFSYEGRAFYGAYNNYTTYVRMTSVRSTSGVSVKFSYPVALNAPTTTVVSWSHFDKAMMLNDSLGYCDYSSTECIDAIGRQSLTVTTGTTQIGGQSFVTRSVTDQSGVTRTYQSLPQSKKLIVTAAGNPTVSDAIYLNDQGPTTRDGPNPPSFADFTDAIGTVYQYRYNEISGTDANGAYLEINGTRTSSDGRIFAFVGNRQIPRSTVVKRTTDEIGRVTQYNYDPYFRPAEVIFPEGNSMNYAYDTRGNITSNTNKAKPGTGLSDLVWLASYPLSCANVLTCNKPNSVTDPKGSITEFTYDPAHGGILTESAPADANGVRPIKRNLYAQRSAWLRNADGSYSASTPIWLLSETRTCKATATVGNSCAGGTADEIVTTYDYGPNSGPNSLLLRGVTVTADGQALRTCFLYDEFGRKLSETKPLGTGATCP